MCIRDRAVDKRGFSHIWLAYYCDLDGVLVLRFHVLRKAFHDLIQHISKIQFVHSRYCNGFSKSTLVKVIEISGKLPWLVYFVAH